MATTFKWGSLLPKQLNAAFAVAAGHDHDGVNSKAVTVGTVADDAITTAKIIDDAVTTAKILDDNITSAKILADNVTTVKILDANVTLAKLATTAKTQVLTYQVEDLAANGDISTRCILECPAGLEYTITAAKVISNGTAAGIDDSNTSVVAILNATNSIASETYDSTTAFPAVNVSDSLGALDATYKVLAAGEKLHFTVTNGTTANTPLFILQIEYTVADA